MTSPISPWAQRVQQLVVLLQAGNNYESDVSTARVSSSLSYLAMRTAKYLHVMEEYIPKENPWIASLMLYVCLGDTKPDEEYGDTTEFEAGACIGQALRAGWSIADMLQAIEWEKETMPYYPTVQQWATIFEVTPEAILEAQRGLVRYIVDTLGETEKNAWSAACSLDISFEHWKNQLNIQTTASLCLPDLGMDT